MFARARLLCVVYLCVSTRIMERGHRSNGGEQPFFTGTATFVFANADALRHDITVESCITGMTLFDEEGTITTSDTRDLQHFSFQISLSIESV